MDMETAREEQKAPILRKQCQLGSAGRDLRGVVIRDRAVPETSLLSAANWTLNGTCVCGQISSMRMRASRGQWS
jgi:hypothetical protein